MHIQLKFNERILRMNNDEVRQAIRKHRIRNYEIAAILNVSEFTFCRWFRKPLTDEQQGKILSAIDRIKAGELNET